MSTAILALSATLAIAIPALGASIAQGKIASTAMESIARQPESAGEIRSTLIIALALVEALAIYGLLIAFMLIAKI